MRFDRHQIGLHLPWAILSLSVSSLLIAWFILASYQSGAWLGGGSSSGLACGIAAGLIIAFEMLLWPRKFMRRLRLIPARYWLAAHIWFGLASGPLAIFHCGFHLGGMLPTILMALFLLTLTSGVFGLVLQNLIPRLALRVLPAETIYSQIDHVSRQNVDDLRHELTLRCGLQENSERPETVSDEPAMLTRSSAVVGSVYEVGLVKGRTLRTRSVEASPVDRKILWEAFDQLEPYLSVGKRGKFRLMERSIASQFFADLRRACHPQSHEVITSMEECYEQRQQFDLQRRMHHWLHAWLPVHIGLSVGTTVLLIVHVFTALKYW